MSTLWTPGGERPVPPPTSEVDDAGADSVEEEVSEEELAAHIADVRERLARTPAGAGIANHSRGLFELAGLHLNLQPPQLAEAQLSIDAMAAVVEGLTGRLGEQEPELKEALAQLRLAFVQVRAANLGSADPPPD